MEQGPSSAQATLAHYWDDVSSDTLTGVKDIPAALTESKAHVAITTVFAPLAILVIVYWIGHYAIGWRRSQREKSFQRELRRRHGIPDDDHRPFNVAYQAASIAARNSVRQSLSSQTEHSESSQALQNNPSSATIMEGFRPQPRSRPPIPTFPGQPPVRVPSGSFNFGQPQALHATASGSDLSRAFSQLPHATASASWGPRYSVDNFRATSVPTVPTVSSRSAFAIAAASGSRRSSAVYPPGVTAGTGDRRLLSSAARPATTSRSTGNVSQARVRKRLYLTADEEADEQQSGIPNDKRSRTAGWGSEAMIDGDNEPLWAQSYTSESKLASDQYAPQSGKSKGKRLADDGEGDLRIDGKRRQTKSTKAQRPKPEVVQETRGTKRERKDVDTASVLNDVMPVHKRGRAGDHNPDLTMVEEEDDVEEDDPTVSRDAMCGGRRIGQKWTANGQEYMVGANGDRLRFTTVKESRKRYYMPADSKHEDNLHKVEVFVEKWLTEEQYAKAKAEGLLAWQENENLPTSTKPASSEKLPEGKENQDQDERPRSVSTTAITVSRIPQAQRTANTIWNTPGQSPLQTSSPHTNPFNTPPSATTPQSPGPRRMRYSMGALPATSMNSSRLIPTWEKQEREANALKILRERRAAEAAKTAPAPASTSIANVAPAPAITLTVLSANPSVTNATEQTAAKPSPFSFAAPVSKPADPTPAPATTPAPANLFSFAAPKKDEVPKPLVSAIPAPTTAAATSTTPALFAPQSAAGSSGLPGFGANPSPAPASTPSPFSAPNVTAASAASTSTLNFSAPMPTAANKPSSFAFSAPSNTTKPADSAPASMPFGSKPFGGAAAVPSPFGATPAAPGPVATKPMGGFSFAPTPAAVPSAAPSTTITSTASPFGAPAPKPANSGFSFNTGTASANGATSAKPAGNMFSFGGDAKPAAAPAANGFGNIGAVSSSGLGNATSGQTTNVFGNNTATGSNGFGSSNNSGSTASPFAFGAPKTTGATTSGFGSQPPNAQAATGRVFGSQTVAPASSTFKFGEASAASSTPTASTGSGFQFGAPKPTLSIPQTTSFGAPASATPTTAPGTGFTFGANPAAAASPATPSKPLFSLGAAASPVMGTRQISTSKRVQRAISKPPQ